MEQPSKYVQYIAQEVASAIQLNNPNFKIKVIKSRDFTGVSMLIFFDWYNVECFLSDIYGENGQLEARFMMTFRKNNKLPLTGAGNMSFEPGNSEEENREIVIQIIKGIKETLNMRENLKKKFLEYMRDLEREKREEEMW